MSHSQVAAGSMYVLMTVSDLERRNTRDQNYAMDL